jgi:hypothetical protein
MRPTWMPGVTLSVNIRLEHPFHHDPVIVVHFSMHSPPIVHPKDALSAIKTTLHNEFIQLPIMQGEKQVIRNPVRDGRGP